MLKALLVAIVAGLFSLESRVGGEHMLDRPIIIGPIVGLIMGDFTTGIIVGGQLELVWMGLVGIGTATPPDVVVGSALATALAIQTGISYETTLAMAIPISLLAQIGAIGVRVINTAFAHRADKCAEKGDYRGVEMSTWFGASLFFLYRFIMVFVGLLIGSDAITAVVEKIPAVIQGGLGLSGGILPALGVAMLIQMTWDKKFGAFLLIGFCLAAFLNVSTIGAATVGVAAALLYYSLSGKNKNMLSNASEEL